MSTTDSYHETVKTVTIPHHEDGGRRSSLHTSTIGSQWVASSFLGERGYPYIVAASVGTYWLFVSLIPVYNKYFFKKDLYPYPIATAGIQLGIVAFLLMVGSTIHHCCFHKPSNYQQHFDGNSINSILNNSSNIQSWVFGPHFFWKLKWTAPIGILFGLKYGVTNLGLQMVPAPIHLLLQSTDLVWTLLSAWWINGERITMVGFWCVVGCVLGSVSLSRHVGEILSSPFPAIAVNLLSPILLGLCITTLRLACSKLMCPNNRVGGTVSSVELSCIKLAISAVVALCLACIFEGEKRATGEKFILDDEFFVEGETELVVVYQSIVTKASWHDAFLSLPISTKLGVIGGSFLILVFQVNCTFLVFLTSSIAVGLVGQMKIFPQWITASLLTSSANLHFSFFNVIGSALTMISAGVFAANNWYNYNISEISPDDGKDETSKLDEKQYLLESAEQIAYSDFRDSITESDTESLASEPSMTNGGMFL